MIAGQRCSHITMPAAYIPYSSLNPIYSAVNETAPTDAVALTCTEICLGTAVAFQDAPPEMAKLVEV